MKSMTLAVFASLLSASAFASDVTCTLEENFVQNPVVVGPITSNKPFSLSYKNQTFFAHQIPEDGKIRLMIPLDKENVSVITASKDLKYATIIDGISVSITCSIQ
jgi:hypothetical protein